MRIQTVELTNYQAFLGAYSINVDGKNLSSQDRAGKRMTCTLKVHTRSKE